MSLKVEIFDGNGNTVGAKVTSRGQLVVAPLEFSEPVQNDLTATCTAVNFFGPKAKQQFVLTNIFAHAAKSVGVCGALVEIYEACSVDTTVVSKTIIKANVAKQTSIIFSPLNIILTEGKWLNAKTDDATVFLTIAGYFVDA